MTPARPDDADVEPDEEWKNRLRRGIEESLASMVKEAKDSRDNQLRGAPVSPEDRERLTMEYKTAMSNIRQLAVEQFQIELDRERQERRWASGIPMNPQWTEVLKLDQQTIMDRIKQGGTGSTQAESGRIAESSVEELPLPRPPGARTMSNHDPPPSLPQPPAQQEKVAQAQRDRERVARPHRLTTSMPPSSTQVPSTPVAPARPDDADVEPDEEWKNRLRKEIEENLASMVKEAKDSRDNQLREAPVSSKDRERLTTEYKTAMNNIRQLAALQFQIKLDRERQERRLEAGIPIDPQWTEVLKLGQQAIMDMIKQGRSGSKQAQSSRTAESPVEGLPRPRPPGARTMSNHDPPPSLPQPPAQRQEKAAKVEGDRERVARPVVPVPLQPLAARRGSDAHGASSRDREEHIHSFRKVAGHAAPRERPSLPDTWVTPEATEESEDLFKRPRRPTLEKNTLDKWDPSSPLSATEPPDRERSQHSISERHAAHSPPNSIPAIWRPSISPEEDAAAYKPYDLGRRGSTASMRSVGSATGIWLPATEPIPERPDDDAIHEGGNDREKGPMKGSDRPLISPMERKESGLHRSDSRSYPAPGERDDRAGLATRRTSPISYAAPSSTARPIVSKASSNEEHRDERRKAQYFADRDQPFLLSAGPRSATYDRDLPRPSAGARPIAHIFPRTGDDRDYSPSPPYRDYIPHQHRSSPPDPTGSGERGIAPKHSFSNDDYQDARRDRERERQYSSLSSSRPSYPTPPSSATRTGSREYLHNDSFDDRERSDRHWTLDESDHRSIRARQGSYSSRPSWDETERDRRYDGS